MKNLLKNEEAQIMIVAIALSAVAIIIVWFSSPAIVAGLIV